MASFGIFLMALASILQFFFPVSMAVDPQCDFYQNLAIGQQYYIYNKEYPQNYGGGTSCRWRAVSPENSVIVLSCENIDIPQSNNCQGDRLAVSLTGDGSFNDAHNYCGKGSLSLVTEKNALAVGLITAPNTVGGRFVCTITAIQQDAPTTTESPERCDCGWKRGNRIVGGTETGVNEYPLMAVLIDASTPDNDWFCGASIISERYCLTAAHCMSNRDLSKIAVIVGDHNLTSSSDTAHAAAYRIINAVKHPQYVQANQANDLAILTTDRPIVFSAYVGPVCLPFTYTNQDFAYQTVTALGYGFEDFSGPKSTVLEEVILSVIENAQCVNALPQDGVTYKQICTYGDGQRDTCFADSGGPVLYMDPSKQRLFLVGVTSYGKGCATTTPSVNTRVTSYLTWIVANTGGTSFCIK